MHIWKRNLPAIQPQIEVITLTPEPQSLDEATQRLPAGAYTTLCTYPHRRVLRLENQLHRLQESAQLAGCRLAVALEDVRQLIRCVLDALPAHQQARVRIILDLQEQPGVLYGLGEVLRPIPGMDYLRGVSVITEHLERHNPQAKLTDFIPRADLLRKNLPAGVHEVLMVDQRGFIREGLSSNFFAVIHGQLWTADEDVLPGITRHLVLDEARLAKLPVQMSAVALSQVPLLQEAFITSASRGILPVREINGQTVGSQAPGPITSLLMARFQARLEQELEPLD